MVDYAGRKIAANWKGGDGVVGRFVITVVRRGRGAGRAVTDRSIGVSADEGVRRVSTRYPALSTTMGRSAVAVEVVT